MKSTNMGIPSGEFLASVREALGRAGGPPANAYEPLTDDLATLENRANAVRERIADELPELSRRLGEIAALRGWNVTRCGGVEETLDYVVSLARGMGAT